MIKKALTCALLDGSIKYDDLYYLDDNEFNTMCLNRIDRTPALILVDMVEHNELLERKAVKEYTQGGAIEERAKKMDERELMERRIHRYLKRIYPTLSEYEVIIDIPEPINFESHIPVVDRNGECTEITDDDMVFTGEVSRMFQKKLRKVALYLPSYVDSSDAEEALRREEK